MSIRLPQRLIPPEIPWVDPKTGQPSVADFYAYMREMDAAMRRLLAVYTPVTVDNLPASATAGDIAFASNGRKAGEGAGSGTGVLVFHDGTAWRAVDTGATVAA